MVHLCRPLPCVYEGGAGASVPVGGAADGKIGSVPKGAVEEAVRGIEERFRISANVDREKLAASVRASIALEELSGDYGIDLTVLNDIDPVLLGSVGLRPGFCPTRGDSRLTVVPEGDIGGGLAVYILKLLSGRRANFIEPFYIIHQRNRFAAGHAGPNDYTQCPGNVVVARDERFAKTEYRYAGAPFAWYVFPQGEKTMLHMSEKDGVLKWYARWWRLRLPSITWRAIPIPSSATKPCPRRNCFSGLSRSA